MTVQSTVAHSLDVTDGIIRYNAACKRILSEKVILAHLLKVCVVEYEGCDISEVVQSISDDSHSDGRVIGKDSVNLEVGYSKIEYDILKDICVPGSDEKIYVNIEAQNNYYPRLSFIQKSGVLCCKSSDAARRCECLTWRLRQVVA